MAKKHMSKKNVERFKKKKVHPDMKGKTRLSYGREGVQHTIAKMPVGKKAVRKQQQATKAAVQGDEDKKKKLRKKTGGSGAYGGLAGKSLPHGFSPAQRILLVGEGNFSFARALLRLFRGVGDNIIATSFDSEEDVRQKYDDADAVLAELGGAAGVRVAFGVDATNLARALKLHKRGKDARRVRPGRPAPAAAAEAAGVGAARERPWEQAEEDEEDYGGLDEDDEMIDGEDEIADSDGEEGGGEGQRARASGGAAAASAPLPSQFDRIVFNFPHRGLGIKDQDANIRSNQELLAGFFRCANELLAPGGEIMVTLKTGIPYDLWQPVRLAAGATGNQLRLRTALTFEASLFPGYEHRRTLGFLPGSSAGSNAEIAGKSRTYVWRNSFHQVPKK